MNKSATVIFVFMLFAAFTTQAQTDTTRSFYNESVLVVGDYNPVLDGVTEKINVAPVPNDSVAAGLQPRFSYGITPRRMVSTSSTSGIKAANITGTNTRLYNNYLRFGLGHDFAAFADFEPLADLYYTSTRHDNYAYGIRLFHHTDVSSYGGWDTAAPAGDHFLRDRHSLTRLNLFGKYILHKKHLFDAALAFDREYSRWYGVSDSLYKSVAGTGAPLLSGSDVATAYNNLAFNLGARSLHIDVNQLGYEAHLAMGSFWSRYDYAQRSLALDGAVHYGFPMFSKYKAIAYLHADWTGYRHITHAQASLADCPAGFVGTPLTDTVEGRHLFNIGPYVDFLFNGFKFHAGMVFGFNGYNDPAATSHNLFPDLVVTKTFMGDAMSLTAGFQGGYRANDWNYIRQQNPYVMQAPVTRATVDNNLYAHLRFNFSKKLILNIHVDNHFLKDELFFQLSPLYQYDNVFEAYYLDLDNLILGADFTFVNDEMITMTLGGDYNVFYGLADGAVPPLYVPDLTLRLDTRVNYRDKWYFTLEAAYVTAADARVALNGAGVLKVTEQLPAHFGMGLGAEYVHSRALSFFARIDNLPCMRHYYWANYPAPRFGAMLGLTYTIPTKRR